MGTGSVDEVSVQVDSIAVGGSGVGRDESGRVVFVEGALPGESVVARIERERSRHATARAIEVVEASPLRVEPVCPHVDRGCGGCGWAHVAPDEQRALKVAMVEQALDRIGHLGDASVFDEGASSIGGHRTTVRAAVVDGRPAFRRAHSHDLVVVDSCRVAHPLVEEILVEGDFGSASEVVVRVGAATGERLVVVDPAGEDVSVPDDVVVVGVGELRDGRRVWFHEEVAGVRFRISAESFFQTSPEGARALVDVVGRALFDTSDDSALVDLYCGVGLFAGTVGRGHRVVAVERSRSSIADARVNLEPGAKVIRSAVERWRPTRVDAVVADPARHGLAKAGVEKVDATGADRLALVSCDAGSLGRDAGLLAATGWRHEWSSVVDMFPDTPHVEVVSRFVR